MKTIKKQWINILVGLGLLSFTVNNICQIIKTFN